MLSARIHEYQKPLVVQETAKPTITKGEQVLVKVGATGLCHSDLHLINGDLKNILPLQLPKILGHEIAGYVEDISNSVPHRLFSKGDMVAVFPGWGCGTKYLIYVQTAKAQMTISNETIYYIVIVICNTNNNSDIVQDDSLK
jgi:D-arabinose 1-dehydrogenase-like Zn-dependent alcohol dehydrogenase